MSDVEKKAKRIRVLAQVAKAKYVAEGEKEQEHDVGKIPTLTSGLLMSFIKDPVMSKSSTYKPTITLSPSLVHEEECNADMIRIYLADKSFELTHVDQLLQLPVKKRCSHIHLMNHPSFVSRKGNDYSHRTNLHYQGIHLVIIYSSLLGKSLSYKSGLMTFD
ncbi:hypothetical protein QOT17_025202 [Balamuthia mandrillaris]